MKTWILAAGVLWAASAQAQPQAPVAQTYAQARAVAKAKHEAKDLAGALEAAHLAVKLAKTSDEKSKALVLVAQSYKEQNQIEPALAAWRQVLELPDAPVDDVLGAHGAIGGALMDQGKGAEARAEFNTILASPQADVRMKAFAQFAIAASYSNEKNFERARAAFATVADNAKAEPSLRFAAQQGIGEAYFKERNFAGARAAWEKLLAMPNLPFVLAGGAEARIIDSYVEEKNLEQALKARIRFFSAHNKRVQPLVDAGKLAQAREEVAAMLVLNPEKDARWLALQNLIGEFYLRERLFPEARQQFQSLIDLAAKDVEPQAAEPLRLIQQVAQHRIGLALAAEGKATEARSVREGARAASAGCQPQGRDREGSGQAARSLSVRKYLKYLRTAPQMLVRRGSRALDRCGRTQHAAAMM